MAILLIEAKSVQAADSIASEVAQGVLWGVSMGTTSSASSYSDYALVECTTTRAAKIADAAPDDVFVSTCDNEPPSFTESETDCKVWYLRGML